MREYVWYDAIMELCEGYVWYDATMELCEGICMIWCYNGIMWGNMYDMML